MKSEYGFLIFEILFKNFVVNKFCLVEGGKKYFIHSFTFCYKFSASKSDFALYPVLGEP